MHDLRNRRARNSIFPALWRCNSNKGPTFAVFTVQSHQRFMKPQNDSVSRQTTSTYDEASQTPSIIPSTRIQNAAPTAPTCVQDDDELRDVISAWPTLPEAVRARILGLVEGAIASAAKG